MRDSWAYTFADRGGRCSAELGEENVVSTAEHPAQQRFLIPQQTLAGQNARCRPDPGDQPVWLRASHLLDLQIAPAGQVGERRGNMDGPDRADQDDPRLTRPEPPGSLKRFTLSR